MIEKKFIGEVGIFHTTSFMCGGSLICIYNTNLHKVKEKMNEIRAGLERVQ